jgi:hypothetical protein
MLYCGGYLIERHKDADGNLVKGNNWIKWANYGRENLHNRGHQMQKGISLISWWIKEDTVPLFSRNGIQLVCFNFFSFNLYLIYFLGQLARYG